MRTEQSALGANARNTSKLKGTVLKRDNKSRLRRCCRKVPKKLKVVVVGDNVLVPVPNVDRAKIDHPNLLAVVMEEKAEGLYRLGTRSAV